MSLGSTYLRRDGRWESRLSLGVVNGKRQSKSFYGRTREEAEGKLISALLGNASATETEMTVKELCAEWLYVSSHRVKLSTLANYRMKIEKHIIPQFGDMMCCEVTSKMAYGFMQDKLDNGLSARYVADIIVLLKTVFKYAQREYIIANPFYNIVMPKCAKPEVRLLTDNEQKKLRGYLNEHNNSITLGITLALAMGLRVGEVCGLMWSDIDLKKRILTVNRTVQRVSVHDGDSKTKVIISPPKSQTSAREIPIPAGVFSMLKKMQGDDEHYIVSGSTKPTEPRTMQYHFAKILKNADLPSVRFHSLRHSMASAAIDAGFDVKTLAEILGHARLELTMNLYVHSNMDRKRRCMHNALFSYTGGEKLIEYYSDVKNRLEKDRGNRYGYHFTNEYFYIYITAHEHKHFSHGGTGLRNLVDRYVFLNHCSDDLDTSYIETELSKIELLDYEKKSRDLALKLFNGVKLDTEEKELLDYYIFSGTYGTTENFIENRIKASGGGITSRIRYGLDRFTVPVSRDNPSYKAYEAQYPFFYKHKLFLPVLPFYRLIHSLMNSRKRIITEIRTLMKI